jgi:hypothetical protein
LVGLAGVVVISAIWLSAHLSARPGLVLSDVDFGSYIPGQTLERAVCIRNEGRRALAIYAVEPCCGMTLPFGFPATVGPRSVAYVVVRLDTPASYGPIGATLTLRTNDPRNTLAHIAIRATPDDSVTVSPTRIDLGYVVAGSRFADVSTIAVAERWAAAPVAVASTPDLAVSLRQSADGKGVQIDLRIAEEAPRGALHEYLYVKTGVARQPNLIIPVSATIERGLRPRPQQVYFGPVTGTRTVSRHIALEVIGSGWDTPHVESVACEGMEARLDKTAEDRFDLCVSLDPVRMPKTVNGHIVLHSGAGDRIEIPVIAARKDDAGHVRLE